MPIIPCKHFIGFGFSRPFLHYILAENQVQYKKAVFGGIAADGL
jgi:hypothetical protein